MRLLLALVFCCRAAICAIEVDFDYVVVGSSPISLLEALYRSYTGARVLVIESSPVIGGAWRTIDICQIANVDMGCHQLGGEAKVKQFLEKYVGCSMVPMDNPYKQDKTLQSADKGFYFSHGCHELMSRLYQLIHSSNVALLLGHKIESVYLDFDREIAEITTNDRRYTVTKLVVTPRSYIKIENYPDFPKPSISKYSHLYLLVHDPSPVCFTYQNSFCKGAARVINLTPFSLGLQGTGHQLIAIQTYGNAPNGVEFYLEQIKKKGWLHPSASLLACDSYVYEQAHFGSSRLLDQYPMAASFFEVLKTDHLWYMANYIEKWEAVFRPIPK